VYLFHAIDLLDGSLTGGLADTVATLRRPVAERRAVITGILDALARESVTTTGESLARYASSRSVRRP